MTQTDPQESPGARNRLVPLVGIGASAGGLEALGQLFEALTPDLGLAYLIVSHMDPRHESHLAEVLAKRTAVPMRVGHEQVIEPDHAYVIPPDTVMTVSSCRRAHIPACGICPWTPCSRPWRSSARARQ